MESSILDTLRARPVAAKSRAFKVKVPEPDKQEPVDLLVEIVDKREEEQLDRRDLLRRIESKRMVQEEVTDDTIARARHNVPLPLSLPLELAAAWEKRGHLYALEERRPAAECRLEDLG